MSDMYDSRLVRVFAFLVVAVPAALLFAFLVAIQVLPMLSRKTPYWTAVGISALSILGLLAFVLFGWWLRRISKI